MLQAGAAVEEELAELSDEEEHFFAPPLPLLYPSAYQPPPFSWKLDCEMIFLRAPEQLGQVSNGLSERLCHFSMTSLQDWHSYS